MAIPEDMGAEALNVSLRSGELGRKRPASTAVTLSGDSFSGTNHLARFVPGQDESAAELFIVSNDGTTKILRVASAATAANLTLTDNVATKPQDVSTVTLNNKLFIAYDSTVNRLHVFAPNESTTTVRRVGLAPPAAAPSVADQGSGTYFPTSRYYRVRYRVKSGSTILRQSEPSAQVAFTPNGTSTSARVTKPASVSEGETHWVLEAAAEEAGPFYEIAETVVGTTTYDDTALVATYDENEASATLGGYYPFPACKYILGDGVRLYGLGVWESAAGDSVAPIAGRLYFTPATRTTTINDDDERVQDTLEQSDWIDLNISGGGTDRGLAGPINGRIYAFQSRGVFMIVPTGDATQPIRRVPISDQYGAVSHHSLVVAEDEAGAPALYFLDPQDGPRRIGLGADVQWLGKDVKDIWDTVNLSATTVVAWGLYDPTNKQVKWWVSTGASNEPDTMIVHHVTLGRTYATGEVRYGMAKWTGNLAAARHGVMFASTLAATRPLTNVPYAGNTTTALFRQDGAGTQDHGTSNFQGYVQSKAFQWGPLARRTRLTEAYIAAKAQSATSIRHRVITDWSAENRDVTVSLAASGTETRVRPRVEGLDVTGAITVQIELGDSAAANTQWTLDRWYAVIETQDGAG